MNYVEKNRGFITAHKLMEFERCQFCYFMKYVAEEPDRTEDKDCFLVGQAFDDLVTLSKDEWRKKYAVVRARHGKAVLAFATKTLLTEKMGETLESMEREFRENHLFKHDPKKKILSYEVKGLKLRGELDDYELHLMRDVKTTASVVSMANPRKEIFEKYLFQMSFYSFLLENTEDDKADALLEIVDKYTHFSRSMAVYFTYMSMQGQYNRILSLLDDLILAQESGCWEPAKDQNVLWECPYYGFLEPNGKAHGRPDKPIIY